MSALDASVVKNWLDASYNGESMNVFLDPGSIPASYVDSAWAASQGLLFQRLESPKRIRYPTGEIVYTFACVEFEFLIIKKITNKNFITPKLKLFCVDDLSPQIILGSRHLYELNLYSELPKLEMLRQQQAESLEDCDVDVPTMAAMDQQNAHPPDDIIALVSWFRDKNIFSEDLPNKPARLEPIKIELVENLPSVWPPRALQGAPRKQPFEYLQEIVKQT